MIEVIATRSAFCTGYPFGIVNYAHLFLPFLETLTPIANVAERGVWCNNAIRQAEGIVAVQTDCVVGIDLLCSPFLFVLFVRFV
jgi:hypothetical protein